MFKKIYIEITNICNLNCSFCPPTKRDKKYMSITDFKAILERIKGNTNYITLHIKGEPLMHPELDKILAIAKQYNMNAILTTNGRLLRNKIDIINESSSIKQINISLHSYDLNDLSSIDDILDTVKLINPDHLVSLRIWNLDNEKENSKIIDYIVEKWGIKHKDTSSIKYVKITSNIFINQDIEFEWPSLNQASTNDKGKCYGLRSHIGILVDGTVVPCCLDNDGDIPLGNILKEPLDSILNTQKCKEIISGFRNNKLVESLCKRCKYIERFNDNEL